MTVVKTKIKSTRSHKSLQQSRMNFRLAPEIKNRIARAAALTGQDLTEFAVSALNEKAEEVIDHHDHLLLGSMDYNFFLNSLSDATVSKPSNRSIQAAERYKSGKRKGVRYHLAD